MKNVALKIAAVLATSTLAQPLYAGKKDDAWAQCLWSKAPKSAANWIAMPFVKGDGLSDKQPHSLLALRLQGYCREQMTVPGKSYPASFSAKSVREALIATKPNSIGNDVGPSDALRCEVFEDDVMLGVSLGYGDPSRMHPRAPATSIKCQRVNDDGTLTDA